MADAAPVDETGGGDSGSRTPTPVDFREEIAGHESDGDGTLLEDIEDVLMAVGGEGLASAGSFIPNDTTEEQMDTSDAPPMPSAWGDQVDAAEARMEPLGPSVTQEDDAEEDRVSVASSETSGRSRHGSQKGQSPRVSTQRTPRAPSLQRAPTDDQLRRFFSDPYTRTVLYPERFAGETAKEEVKYLADHITGRPQHTYVMSKVPGYGGASHPTWLAQSPKTIKRDQHPSTRWSAVSRVANAAGHTAYPLLHPEVTIPVTRLPVDQMGKESAKLLYIAWLESGMRCPVAGCEPWAALDSEDRNPLPRPSAMVLRDRAHLSRKTDDCSQMDPLVVCGPRSKSAQEHMYPGFECVLEHWAHFHMKGGKCFSAPCCSSTRIEDLPETCHGCMFPSITDAVNHLVKHHRGEVETQQGKWKEAKAKSTKKDDDLLLDPNSLGSVAQQMVIEFMWLYVSKVSIARVMGRKKWFTDAILGRVVVGHFLKEVDETQQGWEPDHVSWLRGCRETYARWIAPASTSAPPPKPTTEGGYRDAAVTRTSRFSAVDMINRATPASSKLTAKEQATIASTISARLAPIVKPLPPPTGIMTALYKSVGIKTSAAASILCPNRPSPQPTRPSSTATSSSEYLPQSEAPPTRTSPRSEKGAVDRLREESSSAVSNKRPRLDDNSAQTRGPAGKKAHNLVDHLKTSSRNWREQYFERDNQYVELEAKFKAAEKELREIHATYDNKIVQLDLQLKTHSARGDKYRAESDRYRKERDDARSARDSLTKQVAALTQERDNLTASVQSVRNELTQLRNTTHADQEELRNFRQTGTYVVPSGGKLRLEHQASRSEVLWQSEGSLDNGPPRSQTHTRAAWESLRDLMSSHQRSIGEARRVLDAHLHTNPEADPYAGIYSCVREMHVELEGYVTRWLAAKLPTPGDPTTSLADRLPQLPIHSTGRLVVDTFEDNNALDLAKREAEMYKDLAEQRTRDMDKLFAHEKRNTTHTGTLANALSAFVERFRDLALDREEESANPQLYREQQALERETQELQETIREVAAMSQPVRMTKREEQLTGEASRGRDTLPSVTSAPPARSAAAAIASRSSSTVSLSGASSSGETEDLRGPSAQSVKPTSKAKPKTPITSGGQAASAIPRRQVGKGSSATSAKSSSLTLTVSAKQTGAGPSSSKGKKGSDPSKKR